MIAQPAQRAGQSVVLRRIPAAAKEPNTLRERWLSPPEWVKDEVVSFLVRADGPWGGRIAQPDAESVGTVHIHRRVARDAECAKKLARRTLTAPFNERPAWLLDAHRALDAAVCAAYAEATGMQGGRWGRRKLPEAERSRRNWRTPRSWSCCWG